MNTDSKPHSELRERITLCREQIEASPYSHTIAAGWYAEDVESLLEQYAAAQQQLDQERKVVQKRGEEIDRQMRRAEGLEEQYEVALEASRQYRNEKAELQEQVQTLERKLRDAPLGGDGSHWADCWRSHIDCAAARVESLEEQLDTARHANELLESANQALKERNQFLSTEQIRADVLQEQYGTLREAAEAVLDQWGKDFAEYGHPEDGDVPIWQTFPYSKLRDALASNPAKDSDA